MKQQLKKIIAREINNLEMDLINANNVVNYYNIKADKNDTSYYSKHAFLALNTNKNKLRKMKSKLENLRKLQKEVKSMVGYITKESSVVVKMNFESV